MAALGHACGAGLVESVLCLVFLLGDVVVLLVLGLNTAVPDSASDHRRIMSNIVGDAAFRTVR